MYHPKTNHQNNRASWKMFRPHYFLSSHTHVYVIMLFVFTLLFVWPRPEFSTVNCSWPLFLVRNFAKTAYARVQLLLMIREPAVWLCRMQKISLSRSYFFRSPSSFAGLRVIILLGTKRSPCDLRTFKFPPQPSIASHAKIVFSPKQS